LARWLATALDEGLQGSKKARSRRGRPKTFDLVKSASVSRISRATLSKLLAPALRPAATTQRFVTVGVLRRLARLPGGEKCIDFVLTARERAHEARLIALLSIPLTEPEASLLLEWLESPDGEAIRGCARRLSRRSFDGGEILDWLRWVLRPFVSSGVDAVVARSWSELTQRERTSYLSGSLRLVDRILANRKPVRLQVLLGTKRIDWEDTLTRIANDLGIQKQFAE